MIFFTILLVITITAAHADKRHYDLEDAEGLFEEFLQKYNKAYSPEERVQRLDIFKETLKDINARNARHPRTTFGINKFADLTTEERKQYRGFVPLSRDKATKLQYPPEAITAPDQFDWRDRHVVTHVKNQAACGSCWIFSAIGVIEGQYAIKHNQSLAFSEQQALDCVPTISEDNCNGGWPHLVFFQNAMDVGNMLEKDYPYVAEVKTCHQNDTMAKTHVTGFSVVFPDEETLKQLLYTTGPLSVALDAADLGSYEGGIIHPDACSDNVDHAVVLVGYGVENGEKYWILKNSWGEGFGESGYFRLLRGVDACKMGSAYTATCTVV